MGHHFLPALPDFHPDPPVRNPDSDGHGDCLGMPDCFAGKARPSPDHLPGTRSGLRHIYPRMHRHLHLFDRCCLYISVRHGHL